MLLQPKESEPLCLTLAAHSACESTGGSLKPQCQHNSGRHAVKNFLPQLQSRSHWSDWSSTIATKGCRRPPASLSLRGVTGGLFFSHVASRAWFHVSSWPTKQPLFLEDGHLTSVDILPSRYVYLSPENLKTFVFCFKLNSKMSLSSEFAVSALTCFIKARE